MDHLSSTVKNTKGYMRGMLLLVVISWLIGLIGFYRIGFRFWFVWAPLMALSAAIPVLGQGTVLLPWALTCFLLQHPATGGKILLLYSLLLILRQILLPWTMGHKIGLAPWWTFLAMVCGFWLLGDRGLFLGPVAAAIQGLLRRFSRIEEPPVFPSPQDPFAPTSVQRPVEEKKQDKV